MKKIILTLALVVATATSAFAQFGLSAGYAHNMMRSADEGDPLITDGLYAEATYTLPIAGGLSLVPGVRYTFLGNGDFKGIDVGDISDLASIEASISEHYIAVPLMLQYCLKFGEARLFAFAGPTLELGLASNLNVVASVAGIGFDQNIDLFGEDGIFTRTDVAVTGGAGIQIHKFFVKASYDFGLLNRSAVEKINYNDQQIRVGVGFLF